MCRTNATNSCWFSASWQIYLKCSLLSMQLCVYERLTDRERHKKSIHFSWWKNENTSVKSLKEFVFLWISKISKSCFSGQFPTLVKTGHDPGASPAFFHMLQLTLQLTMRIVQWVKTKFGFGSRLKHLNVANQSFPSHALLKF